MNQIKIGSKVGIAACSDAFRYAYEPEIHRLCELLQSLGLEPVLSQCIYSNTPFSGSGEERARELMKFYENEEIKAIFDISGGNAANQVIPYLDYESIRNHGKPMFGYSDLTCILNAITAKTGQTTCLYQIRHLMYDHGAEQVELVKESLLEGKNTLFEFPVEWIQGHEMEGTAVGGNLRCLLKLAGTPYFPDMKGKILVLESYSGKSAAIASLLTQLKMMGVYEQIDGIVFGTFTELEQSSSEPSIEELATSIINRPALPIVKTKWIGHGTDAKAVRIGEKIRFS